MTSEASRASPVTIENSLNTTLKLRSRCTRLALFRKEKGMWGGDRENRGDSGTLHSLGIESASMLSTRSKTHSAMLQSMLNWSPKPNTARTSMLANMHRARCSPRRQIRQRWYWFISAVSYWMWRRDTLHTTENHWASGMQYYTGTSTYMEPSSHFWYTRTIQPCVGSSHIHTSP